MSFTFVSASDAAAVPLEELHALANKAGFSIEPSSVDEKEYHSFHTSFTLISKSLADLPAYIDPRLIPVETTQPRVFDRPSSERNPLNAWSFKAKYSLKAKAPTSQALAGKRIAIKANVSVAGCPLDIGTSPLMFEGGKYPVSSIDATVVRRLLLAGAEIVGTGTCENMSLSGLSTTAHIGPVHNAWAKDYATGGSSSGVGSLISMSDVAQAATQDKLPFSLSDDWIQHCVTECVDGGIGGDQGGSIRLPSHYAGIYGLKPTYSLVPYTGIMSLGASIDHTGPMARSLPDLITMLEVIAGADGIDQRQSPWVPLRENVPSYSTDLSGWQKSQSDAGHWPSAAATGLRIGVLTESTRTYGMSPSLLSLFEQATTRFTTQGATVIPISIPLHLLAPSIWSLITRSSLARNLRNTPPDLLSYPMPDVALRRPDQWMYEYFKWRNPAVVNALLNAAWLDTSKGQRAEREAFGLVAELKAAYDAAFAENELDVLILPVTRSEAPRIPDGVHGGEEGTTCSPAEATRDMLGVTANTCPFNLSGHPAMSLPMGWIEVEGGKLPAGMQIVGRHFRELDIFKAAAAWEAGGRAMEML